MDDFAELGRTADLTIQDKVVNRWSSLEIEYLINGNHTYGFNHRKLI